MTGPLDNVMAVAMNGVEAIGSQFTEPGDDWAPVLVIQTKGGEGVLVGIAGEFFATTAAKDRLAQDVMPDLIRQHEGVATAFVSSSWYIESELGDELPEGSLADHPKRKEAVFVSGLTATSHRLAQATIVRTEWAPPTLDPWVITDDAVAIDGRMIVPLRQALSHQG